MIIQNNITIDELEYSLSKSDQDSEIILDNLKTSDLSPGLLVFLIQYLITRKRQNSQIKIAFKFSANPFKDIGEFFRSNLHFYAWSFFSGESLVESPKADKDNNWVHDAFKLNKEIFHKVEELLSVYNLDIKKIFELDDSKKSELEQYKTKYSIHGFRPEVSKKSLTKTQATEYYRALFSDRSEARREKELHFFQVNADHISELNKSQYFYSNGRIKKFSEFKYWIDKLMKFSLPFSGSSDQSNKLVLNQPKVTQEISRILYELIQNTEEWARTKFDSDEVYESNIRGVHIKANGLDTITSKEGYKNLEKNNINKYLFDLSSKPHYQQELVESRLINKSKVIIIEISVIDAGPGLARRWTSKDYFDLSHDEEQQAVKECFIKNFTTDNTSISNLKGKGLSRILRIIGKKGFLRVRTGRVDCHRNFLESPLKEIEENLENLSLDIEESNNSIVEGTTISIVYPITIS